MSKLEKVSSVPAGTISGTWIGTQVRFRWVFPGSGVECDVWGEIREVHHNPEGVTIWLANTDVGTGDKTGFTIPDSTPVTENWD